MIHIPDRAKEVLVSASSRNDARGRTNKNETLGMAITDIEAERNSIKLRMTQIDAKMRQLNMRVQTATRTGKRLSEGDYAAICREQELLTTEKLEWQDKLAELKTRMRSLNRDAILCGKDIEDKNMVVADLLREVLKEIGVLKQEISRVHARLTGNAGAAR